MDLIAEKMKKASEIEKDSGRNNKELPPELMKHIVKVVSDYNKAREKPIK